jgi:hypothetical protein
MGHGEVAWHQQCDTISSWGKSNWMSLSSAIDSAAVHVGYRYHRCLHASIEFSVFKSATNDPGFDKLSVPLMMLSHTPKKKFRPTLSGVLKICARRQLALPWPISGRDRMTSESRQPRRSWWWKAVSQNNFFVNPKLHAHAWSNMAKRLELRGQSYELATAVQSPNVDQHPMSNLEWCKTWPAAVMWPTHGGGHESRSRPRTERGTLKVS